MRMDATKFMNRKHAAEYCQSKGFPCAAATLAKYFSVGGGPEVQHFGRKPLYSVAALDSWIAGKLTAPRRSSSEAA